MLGEKDIYSLKVPSQMRNRWDRHVFLTTKLFPDGRQKFPINRTLLMTRLIRFHLINRSVFKGVWKNGIYFMFVHHLAEFIL